MRAHLPERDDDVPRLERPGGRLGQERRVEHEVVGVDDRRAALAEQARDVRAGEAAADDERPAARLAPRRHRAYDRTMGVTPGVGHRQRRRARGGRRGGRPAARRERLHGRHGRARRGDGRGAPRREGGGRRRRSRSSRARSTPTRTRGPTTSSSPGIGHARNLAVAASGHAVIAVGGSCGTLAEIAFALRLGRPVVVLGDGPVGGRRAARVDAPPRRSG